MKACRCLLLASAFALLACGVVVTANSNELRPAVRDLSALERDTVDAINETRERAGLRRLVVSAELTRIARAHSEYQAKTGRSGHVGAGGTSPVDRARRNGIDYHVIAENVASNYGYSDPVGVAVSGWMKSSGHRKNILNPVFRQTGVGVVVATDGSVYFTQMFLDPPASR